MTGPTSEAIRILVCGDSVLIREGVKAILSSHSHHFVVVGEASTAAETLSRVDDMLPDVVIMDVVLPDMDGVEVIRGLRQGHPSVSVIVLTPHEDTRHIMDVYRAGAAAYLMKGAGVEEVLTA